MKNHAGQNEYEERCTLYSALTLIGQKQTQTKYQKKYVYNVFHDVTSEMIGF